MTKLVLTAPHPTLRQTALPIKKVDKKLLDNIQELLIALEGETDPPGVGMAFPQINKSISGLAYRPEVKNNRSANFQVTILLNPVITSHSLDQSFGEDPDEPDLEGCLSVPNLYGPVPRWNWVELKYEIIKEGQLALQTQRFTDYHARIIQHELDHLNGILFTDHLIKLDLPAYVKQGNEFVELTDRDILQIF